MLEMVQCLGTVSLDTLSYKHWINFICKLKYCAPDVNGGAAYYLGKRTFVSDNN